MNLITLLLGKIERPNNREFILSCFDNTDVVSDENMLSIYGKKYMRRWSIPAIVKKGDSLRKMMWKLKKKWVLKELYREEREVRDAKSEFITSDQIFYTLSHKYEKKNNRSCTW